MPQGPLSTLTLSTTSTPCFDDPNTSPSTRFTPPPGRRAPQCDRSRAVEVQMAQEDHCLTCDIQGRHVWNAHKAPGPDGIPGRALIDQLVDVFAADVFKFSTLTASPTCFKETSIVPVPKKTKILSLDNYHPIALSSTNLKCFEKFVKSLITSSFLESLDPLQFTYRPNRSTEDTIRPHPPHCPFPYQDQKGHICENAVY
ncbi:hypothetical protein L3Q82_019208 [Scortum barcoo]|uniref:Uncharacterized protein n=1 Tax=Scortum barcoo TaxID=214431 RepID=A0ACB8VAM4_9TELE|nr:hypothetical protein L3Q82_019208 [Scortum barcoo]